MKEVKELGDGKIEVDGRVYELAKNKSIEIQLADIKINIERIVTPTRDGFILKAKDLSTGDYVDIGSVSLLGLSVLVQEIKKAARELDPEAKEYFKG